MLRYLIAFIDMAIAYDPHCGITNGCGESLPKDGYKSRYLLGCNPYPHFAKQLENQLMRNDATNDLAANRSNESIDHGFGLGIQSF
ncbi:hypothetical protein D1872_301460 [compost metagenome]